jgi:hypothetical protein
MVLIDTYASVPTAKSEEAPPKRGADVARLILSLDLPDTALLV